MAVRRRNFTRRQIGFLALAAALVYVIICLFDWLVMSPWAVPYGDRQTLTGDWVGTVTYGSGDRRTAALHLGYDIATSCRRDCDNIRGELRECGSAGTQVLEVKGKAKSRSGSTFRLYFRDDERRPPYDYLHDVEEGSWQGDRITLRTAYTSVNPDGTSVQRPEAASQVAFELHRVGEDEQETSCPS